VLGVIAYLAILVMLAGAYSGRARRRHQAHLATFALACAGTLFSIYLTGLEPFVIGAACAWCLTSALSMAVVLVATVSPARAAYQRLTPAG
jgi:uncharacterized membrane protein